MSEGCFEKQLRTCKKRLGNFWNEDLESITIFIWKHVLLLADVFEKFRSICMKAYGLDPFRYYTSPGLSWDAIFKRSGGEPDLLRGYDMFMMFERIRGGVSITNT